MDSLENNIASKLIQLKAFSVQMHNPFTWSNGWLAPIYLDDRKILSYPSIRNFFQLELARLVAEYYPDADVIAGIATNAIAHGLLVAEQLALPFVSVYPTPKNHGLENQIEGDLRPRQKVVIIENQISVGDHATRVVDAVRDNGCYVLGVVTLFDYLFPIAQTRFRKAEIETHALTDYNTVYSQMMANNTYSDEIMVMLKKWHNNPSKWSKEYV